MPRHATSLSNLSTPIPNPPHIQVLARLDLPDDAFQPFQPNDQAKARVLLESAFCASHPRWREEVAAMVGGLACGFWNLMRRGLGADGSHLTLT